MAVTIQRLDETVVNRIAAGEVIQRPANALKELIENSLDAKSTNIQVVVKQGGMKLLQIQDNGTGIRKEDMNIVCERFTTSKLRAYEDLTNIGTYGFRGEALASISHVAHVTIITRTSGSACAWRASYVDSKPQEKPKPCAGNQGTVISAEDLFYNTPIRKKALKNASEEHAKITEVVSRYAIHNAKVGFSLKKQSETSYDVHTPADSTVQENIRILHGASIARELLSFSHRNEKLAYSVSSWVTNANYSNKKCVFLLFINHRLVESPTLKRALQAIYEAYLPKHSHPFMYMSLEIEPQNVDVNVHPTKHEVHFLHEDQIIEDIQNQLEKTLLQCKESRTMFTRTLVPANTSDSFGAETSRDYDHSKIRTDCKLRKLDSFVQHVPGKQNAEKVLNPSTDTIDLASNNSAPHSSSSSSSSNLAQTTLNMTSKRRDVKLSSVLALRAEVEKESNADLRALIHDHTFVGVIDAQYSVLQYKTQLYLIDTTKLSRELFYQLMLLEFGNMGLLRLSEPAPIRELVLIYLELSDDVSNVDRKDSIADSAVELLVGRRDMLADYFSLNINENGEITHLPLLLASYIPPLEALPSYIFRLLNDVNWDEEKACFQTFCRVTADFYSVQKRWWKDAEENEEKDVEAGTATSVEGNSAACDTEDTMNNADKIDVDLAATSDSACQSMDEKADDVIASKANEDKSKSEDFTVKNWRWSIEHVVYPAMRRCLRPPRSLNDEKCILQIADLHELYKVFERC